ncbi:hypothetical protein CEP54_011696 [Fusarium duplospermum]|uniref:TLC domain-containing protein n=1 Tax=Fusarium duplospermum TaxID=1325734 RepID=A0A428PD05_9HYPO|nr:hypothetical protein CEP54_011696 [Fusarium duplospermum]
MSAKIHPSYYYPRRKGASAKRWFVENQIGLCLCVTVPVLLAQTVAFTRPYTTKFLSLSYYDEKTGDYGLGFDDVYLVLFLVAVFTGLRAATMQYSLVPLAKRCDLKGSKVTRFSEQSWMIIYYTISWNIGMYIYATSPYWLNLRGMWTGWPNRETTVFMKSYMIAQLAFWLQQIIVINIEKPRKDHWQMFSHHIVTIGLVYCSYRYGLTRVGNVVLVLMDLNDLFFSVAKCLKYLKHQTLCDIMFGIFVVSWVLLRHVAFCLVIWSVYAHTTEMMKGCYRGMGDNLTGPFDIPTDGSRYWLVPLVSNSEIVCYDSKIMHAFLSGLLFLQGLMILWFIMIFKLVVRVLLGENAEDTRSDDEAENKNEQDYLEVEVGPENLCLPSRSSVTGLARSDSRNRSRGVSTSLQSDGRKLLDRIGCEKKIEWEG